MAASVAYLINQYPKVSHSFIRTEIRALEEQGVTVERFAVRPVGGPELGLGASGERDDRGPVGLARRQRDDLPVIEDDDSIGDADSHAPKLS